MTNLEQLIEAGNPNGNTLAEIYANIRDKAIDDAIYACYQAVPAIPENQIIGIGASKCIEAIRALKRNPNG